MLKSQNLSNGNSTDTGPHTTKLYEKTQQLSDLLTQTIASQQKISNGHHPAAVASGVAGSKPAEPNPLPAAVSAVPGSYYPTQAGPAYYLAAAARAAQAAKASRVFDRILCTQWQGVSSRNSRLKSKDVAAATRGLEKKYEKGKIKTKREKNVF